ncbi:hypothetical protein PHPALM_14061 [Phytophthora palmivora]|uniref:Uncharacterized protein n=1 Tax=Phytophthora palmivora TaxID=4796 RepID=A0A2P4XVQ1_9STRA|nr:hypothetical protein PHPALM_14061 [Phytophthora palmivora]
MIICYVADTGREPKKPADQLELETLTKRYVALKDAEDLEKDERAEIYSKTREEDRVGGEAIRDAAMKGEMREKKKLKTSKQVKSWRNPDELRLVFAEATI